MEKETKLRALCLLKILYERTDEEHPLSTAELIRIFEEEYHLHVYRTTIASDVEQLRLFGIEIHTEKSGQNKYYISDRLFDIPELKLLIDAVEASKFITEKKSRQLVGKLMTLASKNRAEELKRNLCTEGRIKPGNEQVYYIVDALNDAINAGKKVTFQYFQYSVRKEPKLRNDGEWYVFSPYTLVWNGDCYYVVGFSDKHGKIVNFRVDRIYHAPKILKDDAVPAPAGFDEAEYTRTMFRMYNSEPKDVELICSNDVMDTIIDKFGQDIRTYAYDMNSFRTVVNVAISHVFFSWVFGFRGKVKINGPEDVRAEYEEMVREAAGLLN